MPLYAFANAGVEFADARLLSPVSVAIFAGLVIGKPIDVITFSWLAVRIGLAQKANDLSWSLLAAGALLTGIGFTMSLFIASLAYSPVMHAAAQIGIRGGSAMSGAAGLLALIWLSRRRAT